MKGEPCERAGLPIDMIDTGPSWRDVVRNIAQLAAIIVIGMALVFGASIVMGMILASDWVGG